MDPLLTHRSPAAIAAIALVASYILYSLAAFTATYIRRSTLSKNAACKPIASYPHKDPIFGFDLFLENMHLARHGGFWERVSERYERLGVNTWTQLLLGDRIINTSEPANCKAVLATQFKDFKLPPRRKSALGPAFGHGIFTTDGKQWEMSRALLRPNFARTQVGDLETFESHISRLIDRIPKDGSTVELQSLFFMLTMDSATEFLFGRSTDVLGNDPVRRERGERFADAFTYVTENIGNEVRLGKLATILPDKRMKRSLNSIHEYVQDYVRNTIDLHKSGATSLDEKAEAARPDKYVFIEELAKTGYSNKKIQDELLNILLAGRDTTASLLGYVFYIFARRPDVFDKVRAEVLAIGQERPTFEDLKAMKYLQYTLNETLRLHPIVPQGSRTAVRDTTLPLGGGKDGQSPILVKKGQQVNYTPYVMHRREDIWGKDALVFRPERWSEGTRPGWGFMPFSGGPRICIGQQFALTEASYTVVRLLQFFKGIEKRDDSILTDLTTLSSAVRAGVHVGLTPA